MRMELAFITTRNFDVQSGHPGSSGVNSTDLKLVELDQ
jgi:hypothetical protein